MTESKIYTLELGRIYEEQGYFEKAEDHFSGALKSSPENSALIQALDRIKTKKNDSHGHNVQNDHRDSNTPKDILHPMDSIVPIDSVDQANPIDQSNPSDRDSLAGIVEQWVHLVILNQRAERLARGLER